MLFFSFACAPPPEPFSCRNAAKALGVEGATVAACDPLPNLPEVYQVALEVEGRRTTYGVVVREGQPLAQAGGPALATFLEALPAERRRALTMADVNGLLRAFSAFPDPFGPRDSNFDMPDIGRSSFASEPFRLVLYTATPPPPERPSEAAKVQRATLTGPPWAWAIETREGEAWSAPTDIRLEAR